MQNILGIWTLRVRVLAGVQKIYDFWPAANILCFFGRQPKSINYFMFTSSQFCNIRGKAFSIEIDPKYHVEPDHGVRPIPVISAPTFSRRLCVQINMIYPFKKHS